MSNHSKQIKDLHNQALNLQEEQSLHFTGIIYDSLSDVNFSVWPEPRKYESEALKSTILSANETLSYVTKVIVLVTLILTFNLH